MTRDQESSLLALLLVASSPQANSVIFSYPAAPKAIPRLSRPVYEKRVLKRRKRKHKLHRDVRQPVSVASASSTSSDSSGEEVEPRPAGIKSRRQSSTATKQSHLQNNGLRQSSPSATPAYDSVSSTSSSDIGSEDEDSQVINGSEDEDKPEEGADSPSPISALFHPKLAAHARNMGSDLSAQTQASYGHFLGIDVDILAACLLKRGLKDSKMELVIDYLAFIGHPVWLDRGRQRAKEEQEKAAAATESRKGSFDAASTVSHSARGRSPPPQAESSTAPESSQAEYDASESAGHPSPEVFKPKGLPEPFSPSPALRPLPPSKPPSIRHGNTKADHFDGDLTMFNLVLIIDTPPDKHLSSHLDVYYKDIVVKLTAAIKFEELKDGWLSREAAKVFQMREKAKDQSQYVIIEELNTANPPISDQPFSTHISDLISCSSLCAALAKAFDSVKKGEIAKLSNLNEDLDMSIMLHSELFHESSFAVEQPPTSARLLDGKLEEDGDGLKPWQTVVALEDPKEMLIELEGGPLAHFIEILTPTVSFREYTTLLDLEYFELKELVDHLVYWRKARIVNVVNVRNTYILNPAKALAE